MELVSRLLGPTKESCRHEGPGDCHSPAGLTIVAGLRSQ